MYYEILVTQFTKTLRNLSEILDKAQIHATNKKVDMEVLLQSRLSIDQFPLGRQIQIACDTAKLSASRLSGKDAPSHPDTEKSLTEFKDRIQSTIAYLASFQAADFKEASTRQITQPRWEGQWLTGQEFFMHHALPNLFFHVSTAYAILRHNGVEIGKKDYLGTMPYKR